MQIWVVTRILISFEEMLCQSNFIQISFSAFDVIIEKGLSDLIPLNE